MALRVASAPVFPRAIQAPFAVYGASELSIVPATLLAVILLAAVRRTRPWVLWLLLGTLGGATAVFMNLALSAVTRVGVTALISNDACAGTVFPARSEGVENLKITEAVPASSNPPWTST